MWVEYPAVKEVGPFESIIPEPICTNVQSCSIFAPARASPMIGCKVGSIQTSLQTSANNYLLCHGSHCTWLKRSHLKFHSEVCTAGAIGGSVWREPTISRGQYIPECTLMERESKLGREVDQTKASFSCVRSMECFSESLRVDLRTAAENLEYFFLLVLDFCFG